MAHKNRQTQRKVRNTIQRQAWSMGHKIKPNVKKQLSKDKCKKIIIIEKE